MRDSNKNIRLIKNFINGKDQCSDKKPYIKKYNPHTGKHIKNIYCSNTQDLCYAVKIAERSFSDWSQTSAVFRGKLLKQFSYQMELNKNKIAKLVSVETGKSIENALGEVEASILQADYFAGEGMRLYGKTLTSANANKTTFTQRAPHGIVGLIVPANTPLANISWKIFPALICGNTVILKASEDAPELANFIAKLGIKASLPKGVLNVVQGDAALGKMIVEHPSVRLISFTGSSVAGKDILSRSGANLKRVSLELGGKNPFIVCSDCNFENAINWASLSAFSNAGQRCAAGSRIIVFNEIFDHFVDAFTKKIGTLKLGVSKGSDIGPVINSNSLKAMLKYLKDVKSFGGKLLCGGKAPTKKDLINGYYLLPTLITGLDPSNALYDKEVFGPIAHIESVSSLEEAIYLANSSKYGLTSAIHTQNISTALEFVKKSKSGVVNVNIGTFGSEPHFPFGGVGWSGNGSREPGVEALDVYSELKNISLTF